MKDYIVRVSDLSNETIDSIKGLVRITWISDMKNYIIVEASDQQIDIVKHLPQVENVEEDKCADHES
jgi:hypothetical protein